INGFNLGGASTSAAFSLGYATTGQFTLTNGSTNWIGSISSTAITANVTNQGIVVTLQAAGSDAKMTLGVSAGFATNSSVASTAVTMQGNATTSFTFKVGSGTVAAEDEIDVTIDGISTTALTLSGT